MTSKKYSPKLFRFSFKETLKADLFVGVIAFVSTCCQANAIRGLIVAQFDKDVLKNLARQFYYILTYPKEDFGSAIIGSTDYLFMFLGVFCALVTFGYLMHKNTVNVYFSLGISHSKLFLSRYLACVCSAFSGVFIALAICAALNISVFGFSSQLLIALAYYLLKLTSIFLYSFTITAFVMQLVGSSLESFVYSFVAIFSPFMINTTLSALFHSLIYGSPYSLGESAISYYYYDSTFLRYSGEEFSGMFSLGDFGKLVFPSFSDTVFNAMGSGNKRLDYFAANYSGSVFIAPLIFLAVIILLGAAAYLMSKRRKAEYAGFMGCSPVLQGYCVLTVGPFLGVYVLGMFQSSSLSFSQLRLLLIAAVVIIMAVGYTAVEFIVLRSGKKYVSRLKYLGAELAVFLIGCAVIASTIPVGSVKIPAIGDIESASVTVEGKNYTTASSMIPYASSGAYYGENLRLDSNLTLSGNSYIYDGFTAKEDIKTIISANEKLEELKNSKFDDTFGGDEESKVFHSRIRIEYTLKNGKTRVKNYDCATLDVKRELNKLNKSENMRNQVAEQTRKMADKLLDGDYQYSIALISPNTTRSTVPLAFEDEKLRSGLVNAFADDIASGAMPLGGASGSELLGYVYITDYWLVPDDIIEADPETGRAKGIKADSDVDVSYTDFYDFSSGWLYPVYAEMENTVKFIGANGLGALFENASDAVKVIYCKYDEDSEICKFNNTTNILEGWSLPDVSAQLMWQAYAGENEDDRIIVEYHNSVVGTPETVVMDDGEEIERTDPGELLPENSVTIESPEEVAAAQKALRLQYNSCDDVYYAVMICEDGRTVAGMLPGDFAK